jgi:hypothetical protein
MSNVVTGHEAEEDRGLAKPSSGERSIESVANCRHDKIPKVKPAHIKQRQSDNARGAARGIELGCRMRWDRVATSSRQGGVATSARQGGVATSARQGGVATRVRQGGVSRVKFDCAKESTIKIQTPPRQTLQRWVAGR